MFQVVFAHTGMHNRDWNVPNAPFIYSPAMTQWIVAKGVQSALESELDFFRKLYNMMNME